MLIAFDGIARPVALEGCEDLHACLAAVLRGWRFEEVASPGVDPVITIRRKNKGYRLETPSLGPAIHQPTDVGVVCAFIADLVQVYIADQSSLLCLHCGAAAFAGGLVIFPNQFRAGKSTLLARLAAAGIPVFADDVLPIANASGQGIALGFAPRLRLPLPGNAGAFFRRFIRAHGGPSDDRYLYLDLPPETLARHGRRMPIAACVLLDRRSAGSAQLVPTPKSRGLQRVILQNFARSVPATEIADCLCDLVTRVPCFTLRYSNLDDAAALLQDAFQGRSSSDRERSVAIARRRAPSHAKAPAIRRPRALRGKPPAALCYRRDPAIILHAVESDVFLVDPHSQSIYHLNAVAAGLWRLLREPTSAAEAVEVLSSAFPDVDAQQIRREVRNLLADLLARNLIGPRQPCETQVRR